MTLPFENNTGAIVNKLAKRNLQSAKRRNIMVIVSVALAALLISFAGSLTVSFMQMQNKQVVDTYEAVYSKITEQDIVALKAQSEISRVGKYYLIGEEQSKQGFTGSFVYADEAMLYTGRQQMELLEGYLPEQTNEIIVSESWLKSYVPNATIGDAVSLDTEHFQGKYIISGIMNTPYAESTKTYAFIISQKLLEQHEKYDAHGYRAYIHLNNDIEMSKDQIKASCETIAKNNNLPSPSYNSQYFAWVSRDINLESIGIIALLAAVVLISGCVVIQSIFRISVIEKIQSFGQLRTLGATKKQVARIVHKEGFKLGWCGIIIGTLLGIFLPFLFIPDTFNIVGIIAVCIITVAICIVMTAISMRIPIKMAASVSPIEALRFSSKQTSVTSRCIASKRINTFTLGMRNYMRDKKKAISILVSLSIGGVLLLAASTLLLTYSPEALSRTDFPNGDYKIYIDSEKDMADVFYEGTPLTEALKQEILAIDGVQDVIVTRQSAGTSLQFADGSYGGMGDIITPDNYAAIESALAEGVMPSGSYDIIIGSYDDIKVGVGTTAKIMLGKNEAVVTISGLFDPTKCTVGTGHGSLGLDGAMLFLPSDLFTELLPGIENYDYTWDIVRDPQKDASVNAELQKLVSTHAEIELDTFESKVAYNTAVYTNLFHAMQGITLFISLFGLVNFINTILSNQISQKREVSTLRSVGMTQKQVYQMTVYECLSYVFFSICLTFIVGLPLAYILHQQTSIIAYGFSTDFQFPFLYMGLYVLLLLLLDFALSTWVIHKQKRQSLIEQLRAFE